MVDIFSPAKRSAIMRSIRGKHTEPELAIRKIVRALECKYRLHPKALPGKPDITIPSLKKAIFVHGCFWHGHKRCKRGKLPKTNVAFWRDKILKNAARDRKNSKRLSELGWKTIIIWECQINGKTAQKKLSTFLKP